MDSITFRKTRPEDIEPSFSIRATTRQNPVSREQLREWGITSEFATERYSQGRYIGWVAEDQAKLIGFATGDLPSGEILVLALLPEYEGRGIGNYLLARLIESMRERGCEKLWLSATRNPDIRAYGFYRANGWAPTGTVLENGDEIMVFQGP